MRCQERLHRAARESELRRRSTMVVQGVAGGAYGARMGQVGLDKGNKRGRDALDKGVAKGKGAVMHAMPQQQVRHRSLRGSLFVSLSVSLSLRGSLFASLSVSLFLHGSLFVSLSVSLSLSRAPLSFTRSRSITPHRPTTATQMEAASQGGAEACGHGRARRHGHGL